MSFPATSERDIRRIVQALREVWQGRSVATGSATLTASATTTTVSELNCGDNSTVALSPMTANAAAALATTYVSSVKRGQFVLTHANNAQVDRTFRYAIQG